MCVCVCVYVSCKPGAETFLAVVVYVKHWPLALGQRWPSPNAAAARPAQTAARHLYRGPRQAKSGTDGWTSTLSGFTRSGCRSGPAREQARQADERVRESGKKKRKKRERLQSGTIHGKKEEYKQLLVKSKLPPLPPLPPPPSRRDAAASCGAFLPKLFANKRVWARQYYTGAKRVTLHRRDS